MSGGEKLQYLPRIVLAVLFIGLFIAASLWILQPFLPALVWSTLVAVSTWPLMLAVQRRLWGRRWLAALFMTLALLLTVILPLALAVTTVIENAADIGERVKAFATSGVPAPPDWVQGVPLVGQKLAEDWRALSALGSEELHARLAPYAKDAARWMLGKFGSLAAFFLHLLLTVLLSTVFYLHGEKAVAGVRAFAWRLTGERGERSVALAGQAIRAVAMGVVVTALVQSLLGGIGLYFAGVPMAVMLTAVMFVLAVAQIGAGPVLIIAVIWLYWTSSTVTATLFLAWAVFCGMIDNVLRPVLIKSGADLPLLLIFAGVIGGLLAFGVVGLFVGPVVLALAYTELVAWVTDERNDAGR